VRVMPEVAELTACGLAVEMPVAGSALPGGQSPRVGFFRTAQLPDSPEVTLVPLVCAEEAEMVDVDELVEASEEDEFCRCAVLRGPEANILVPSSLFMAASLQQRSMLCSAGMTRVERPRSWEAMARQVLLCRRVSCSSGSAAAGFVQGGRTRKECD
jgi:hypothetical protein